MIYIAINRNIFKDEIINQKATNRFGWNETVEMIVYSRHDEQMYQHNQNMIQYVIFTHIVHLLTID